MYQEFSTVYDRLMQDVDYTAWALHYRRLLEARGVLPGAHVLETNCGTGNLSLHLANWYKLLASDLSQDMLNLAMPKARTAGKDITFIRQDMREIALHRQVDALVSACDGVNYLLQELDLQSFLRGAFLAIRPGGVLAFDVSSHYKLCQVLGNQPQVFESQKLCYLWQNFYQEDKRLLQMQLAIFVQQQANAYTRVDEQQTQRAWLPEELSKHLTAAGFIEVQIFGEQTMKPPHPEAQRLHIAAIKPKD